MSTSGWGIGGFGTSGFGGSGLDVFRPPARTQIVPIPSTAHLNQNFVNLLVTTLVVTAAPFAGSLFPNPAVAAPSIALRTITQNALTLGPFTKPFTQLDWQNPRGATPSIALRTHIETRKQYYVDTFFGLAGKPNFDQPNPRGPQRSVSLIDQTSSSLAIAVIPPPILNNWLLKDWPNPRGATFPSDLRGHVQQATVRFIGQDKFFGLGGSPCFDWPNPRGYQRSINLNDFAPTRLPTTATPFGQRDWPVPNGKIPASILRTYTQNGITVGLTSPPFKQGDWPVPKGYIPSITLKTFTSSGQFLFASITPYAGQNRVYNWPNPRGAAFPSELRGYIQQATVRFIGKDSFFGLAGNPTMDWPVPKGPLFPISLRCLVNAHMPPIQWGAVDTGNNAGWGPISGVNSPGWGAVNDSNSVTWVLVDVSTDSPTGFK